MKDKFDGASEVAQKVVGTRKVLVSQISNHMFSTLNFYARKPTIITQHVYESAVVVQQSKT